VAEEADQKVTLEQRHVPVWRATRRFHYQLDAIREILNDLLPHVSQLDEKHFTVDALGAIKTSLPRTGQSWRPTSRNWSLTRKR
jgi:hypothetical protein